MNANEAKQIELFQDPDPGPQAQAQDLLLSYSEAQQLCTCGHKRAIHGVSPFSTRCAADMSTGQDGQLRGSIGCMCSQFTPEK